MRRAFFLVLTPTFAFAADAPDFTREIRPILAEHCFKCHGPDAAARKAGLRLDLREGALKGGESEEPAIVPGQPEKSAILARVLSKDKDEVMPPTKEHKEVTAAEVAALRRWIATGAEYALNWAFVPPVKAKVPGAEHPVDALVRAKLAEVKLQPSPAADAATIARRLYLDVIGLPPAPREVDEFAAAFAQGADAAVAAATERLLQRPAYGEKWARHWLDVARYADSNGFEKDLPREQWVWRDWVIAAINCDEPYDRFVVEQIAGDLLPERTPEQVIATGFLRNGMVNEEGAIVPEQFRMEGVIDRMDAVGKAVLGLSLQCAQCHTHKFDPISHDEYYGIFGFLNNTYEAQSWVHTHEQRAQIAKLEAGIAAVEARLKSELPQWEAELAAWERSIVAQQVKWTPLIATELGSPGGLNHPTQEPDLSVLTQGHPTTKGDIFLIAEPELQGVTGLRLEALKQGDMPFGGPGRSKYGTWAITEMEVSAKPPGAKDWEKLKLVNATADFSEPAHKLEEEWAANFDAEKKRTCGPVAFIIDGSDDTGWRADRGQGRRNQESVAVAQFEKPLGFLAGTQLRVALRFNHGGSDNGRSNTQLGRCRISTTTAAVPKAAPVDYAAVLAMQTAVEKRTPEQQRAIFTAWRASRADCAGFNNEIAALWKQYPAAPTSVLHLAERNAEDFRPTHLLDRGAWDKPKHVVVPHTPAALPPLDAAQPTRLDLARWLVDRRSPLAARVAVNRVWQAIFGVGLVETAEDFGTRAPVPPHRALLDWLAVDFMEHGWSQKHLVRTIVTSATWRQSARLTPELRERDPRNLLLARGPRFRAEAEVVRDLALSVSGLLSEKVGGASVFPPVPQNVLDSNFVKPVWPIATGPERYRRALYVFRKRSMPDPVMSSFDAPNGDQACARRIRSNSPLASLVTLNEPIFIEAAQALSQRILREGGPTDAERVDYAYRLCTGRPVRPAERDELLALLRSRRTRLAEGWISINDIANGDAAERPKTPPGTTPQDAAAWAIAARVLLNLDETLTKN